MKKVNLFSLLTLFAVCVFCFTSCSDDDDDDNSDDIAANIIGTWQTTHVEGYWYDDTDDENLVTIDRDVEEDEMERLTFNTDGTCQYSYYSSTYGKWYSDATDYTYKISGDEVIIYDSEEDEQYTYTVLSVTSSTVVIEGTLDEGASYTYRLTLKRVG